MSEDYAEKYRGLLEDLRSNHVAIARNRVDQVSIYSRAIDAIRELIAARREPGPATAKVIEDVQRQVDCGPLDDGEYIFTCLAGREARALIAEWPKPAKPEAT